MKKRQIKEIYDEAFGQDDIFFEKLFAYANNCCKTLEIGEETVSMLFLLPIEIVAMGTKVNAYYLFAAATKSKYRKNGYMAKLLQNTLNEADIPIILKPANKTLIDYYEKFGFEKFTATYDGSEEFLIQPVGDFLTLAPQSDAFFGTYTAMYHGDIGFDINGITFKFTMED